MSAPRHLTGLLDLERDGMLDLFARAEALRDGPGGDAPRPLAGRTVALLFHPPSLRTRVSFAAAVHALGGATVDLGAAELGVAGRERLRDVAQVLAERCDAVVVYTVDHRVVVELAEHSGVPVINARTGYSHPCQVLSDLYTLWRRGADLDRLTVTWIGDGDHVLHSWLEAATRFGFALRVAVPDGFEPDAGLFLAAERHAAGGVRRFRDPREAARGADVVVTGARTRMERGDAADWRRVAFAGYQVDEDLMELAAPAAVFLHGMPAHRGEEVAAAVIDGPRSLVVEQAADRFHLHRALLARLVGVAADPAAGPAPGPRPVPARLPA